MEECVVPFFKPIEDKYSNVNAVKTMKKIFLLFFLCVFVNLPGAFF
jgi:hypothetical protein